MVNMSTDIIKRCPFCGGEAAIDKIIANCVDVECTVCHAGSRLVLCTEGDMENKAIKAWNARKPMDDILERLQDELELSSKEKVRVKKENPLQFDRVVGYSNGIANAIDIVREVGEIYD